MKSKILLIISLFSLSIYSQTYTRKYQSIFCMCEYRFGSTAPIAQTSDGGYILNYFVGSVGAFGNVYNSRLIKTDNAFIPLWEKSLTGYNGKKTLTFIDGSILLFQNEGNPTVSDLALEKIDALGQTIWKKREFASYPISINIQDAATNLNNTITLFGGKKELSFGGRNSSILIDFDLNGTLLNAISIDSSPLENSIGGISNVTKDVNNNLYLMVNGKVYGNDTSNVGSFYVIKLNPSKNILWSKKVILPNPSDYFYDISSSIILNNGDLLIGGTKYNYSSTVPVSLSLIRITENGDFVWAKTTNTINSIISGIEKLSTNEIIASGEIPFNNLTPKNLVLKINDNGDIIWSKKYNTSFNTSQMLQKSSNDWYYAAFSYNSANSAYNQPSIFNTDSNGNRSCAVEDISINLIPISMTLTDIPLTVSPLSLQNPITETTGSTFNITYSDECLPLSITNFEQNDNIKLYPNPSNELINIVSKSSIKKITVYDFLGKQIFEFSPNQLDYSFKIYVSGVYNVRIESENGDKNYKVIINK